MRILAATFLLGASLVFAGCALTAETPEDRGRGRIIERQKMIVYLGQEYPFIWDPEVTATVNGIGRTLSRAIGASDNSFHFYVIDSPTVNAFTSPLGDIFIFSGMLTKMRNSSELAGVLGHEMAHVRADHFAKQQKRAALGSIPGLMAAILSKGDPRVVYSAIAAAQSFQLYWSREMEMECDRLALQYLEKTDFDKEGLLGGLEVIERGERLMPTDAPEHLMTHPIITDRLANLQGSLMMQPGSVYRPRSDAAWERMRAVLLSLTDRPSAVRRRYDAAGEGDSAEARDLLGLVLARQGDYPAAEEEFRLAVERDPGSHLYLADLGAALFHQGKAREAKDVLERSLRLEKGRGRSYSHYYLGEIYRGEGDDAAAKEAFARAVEAEPPFSEAHYQYALVLSGEELLGEADYYFGRAALLRGDYVTAFRSFSRAEARLGSDPVWSSKIAGEMWSMQ